MNHDNYNKKRMNYLILKCILLLFKNSKKNYPKCL